MRLRVGHSFTLPGNARGEQVQVRTSWPTAQGFLHVDPRLLVVLFIECRVCGAEVVARPQIRAEHQESDADKENEEQNAYRAPYPYHQPTLPRGYSRGGHGQSLRALRLEKVVKSPSGLSPISSAEAPSHQDRSTPRHACSSRI